MTSKPLYFGTYQHEVEACSLEAPLKFDPTISPRTIQFYDIGQAKGGSNEEGKYQAFIDVPSDRSMVTFGIAFLPNGHERAFLGNKSSPREDIVCRSKIDFILNYFSYEATRFDYQNKAHLTMDETNTEILKKYLNGKLS